MRWTAVVLGALGAGCASDIKEACVAPGYNDTAGATFGTYAAVADGTTFEVCRTEPGAASAECSAGAVAADSAELAGPFTGRVTVQETNLRTLVGLSVELPQDWSYDDRDRWTVAIRDAAGELDRHEFVARYERNEQCDGTVITGAALMELGR